MSNNKEIGECADNKLYFSLIIKTAYDTFGKGRSRTYNFEYYLNMFLLVLDDVTKWKSLTKTKIYNSDKNFHYKVIQNEFNRWTKYDIFKNAYTAYLNNKYKDKPMGNNKKSIDTFTDTSCFNNKYGRENVGVHPELHKKNTTKIAALVNDNCELLSMVELKTHLKKYEGTTYKFSNPYKNTIEHDIKTVQPLLNNILINIPKKLNIGADKAYILNENFIYNNKNIKLITPKREKSKEQIKKMIKEKNKKLTDIVHKINNNKNINSKYYNNLIKRQNIINEEINKLLNIKKPKYTQKEKYILGKRYLVEKYFRNIKKYDRIMVRKEHNIKNFMSFIYIANLINICQN